MSDPSKKYSFIHSVRFHPTQNEMCTTYAHDNRLIFYSIDQTVTKIQTIEGSQTNLNYAQDAIYASNGEKLIVVNWTNQLMIFERKTPGGLFHEKPKIIFNPPKIFKDHRSHALALSPCGKYLAVAYGAVAQFKRALAIYSLGENQSSFELIDVLNGPEVIPGIPKGIAFSPDGKAILTTFSDIHHLTIYSLTDHDKGIKFIPTPQQSIEGTETGISRPEDIQISSCKTYCGVTNSGNDTLTFYPFDLFSNQITQNTPFFTLKNPEADLHFPHSLAFSPDGSFLIITTLGLLKIAENGDVIFNKALQPSDAKINVYRLKI